MQRCSGRVLPVLLAPLLAAVPVVAQAFFPPPPAPAGNPVTPNKALLGMALFWDEQLSSTDTVACGTCHLFASGGCDPRTAGARHPGPDGVFGTADDRRGSPGVANADATGRYAESSLHGFGAQVTARRAPSVVNACYQQFLLYDGSVTNTHFRDPDTGQIVLTGATALENLVLGPPLNPVEMGHPGRTWQQVAAKIAAARPLRFASDLPPRLAAFVAGRDYPTLFEQVFGTRDVTGARIAMAIATYLRTLVADQSRWDRSMRGLQILDPLEIQGVAVFRRTTNGVAACSTCHSDFETSAHTSGPVPRLISSPFYGGAPTVVFHNIGIRPVFDDRGRQVVTTQAADAGRFRVAMLRNVALAAPYFHNGSMPDLASVVEFYDRGGDFHQNQASAIVPRQLSAADKEALVAALQMLTDPRVAAEVEPFDRPRLGSENGRLPTVLVQGSRNRFGRAEAVLPEAAVTGRQFTVGVERAEPGVVGILVWDPEHVAGGWMAGELPLLVLLSPAATGIVMGLTQTSVRGHGHLLTSFPIPANTRLVSAELYGQWLLTGGSGTLGFDSSDGFRVRIQ